MAKTYLRRKDIIRLGKIFTFSGPDVWEYIRKGCHIVIGEDYLFVKRLPEYKWEQHVDSYEKDYMGYGPVAFIDIKTGTSREGDETYSYIFYYRHGDYMDKFNKGILNAMKMYKFETGKEVSMMDISTMFSNQRNEVY